MPSEEIGAYSRVFGKTAMKLLLLMEQPRTFLHCSLSNCGMEMMCTCTRNDASVGKHLLGECQCVGTAQIKWKLPWLSFCLFFSVVKRKKISIVVLDITQQSRACVSLHVLDAWSLV